MKRWIIPTVAISLTGTLGLGAHFLAKDKENIEVPEPAVETIVFKPEPKPELFEGQKRLEYQLNILSEQEDQLLERNIRNLQEKKSKPISSLQDMQWDLINNYQYRCISEFPNRPDSFSNSNNLPYYTCEDNNMLGLYSSKEGKEFFYLAIEYDEIWREVYYNFNGWPDMEKTMAKIYAPRFYDVLTRWTKRSTTEREKDHALGNLELLRNHMEILQDLPKKDIFGNAYSGKIELMIYDSF